VKDSERQPTVVSVRKLAALLREAHYSKDARGDWDDPDTLAAWLHPRLIQKGSE
jgi:hypothetical protein